MRVQGLAQMLGGAPGGAGGEQCAVRRQSRVDTGRARAGVTGLEWVWLTSPRIAIDRGWVCTVQVSPNEPTQVFL